MYKTVSLFVFYNNKEDGESSFEHLTNSTRHKFPLFNRCLQPAFPIVFPTFPDCISRPYPDYVPDRFPECFSRPFSPFCSRPILDYVPDLFSDYVPDRFPDNVPDRVPDLFPICSRPVPWSHPVPSRHEIVGSRSVPSIKRLPAFPFHSRPAVSKREPFPIPSLEKTPKKIRLRRAKRLPSRTGRCLGYRAYPCRYRIGGWFFSPRRLWRSIGGVGGVLCCCCDASLRCCFGRLPRSTGKAVVLVRK